MRRSVVLAIVLVVAVACGLSIDYTHKIKIEWKQPPGVPPPPECERGVEAC